MRVGVAMGRVPPKQSKTLEGHVGLVPLQCPGSRAHSLSETSEDREINGVYRGA